jgi:hypothetical protein
MRKLSFLLLIVLACTGNLSAQSLPVDAYSGEEMHRMRQLRGEVAPDISFAIRPLVLSSRVFDSLYSAQDTTVLGRQLAADEWKVLPFTWQNQFNTHHPYGWNDGAMAPAKGLQTLFTGGFYNESGRFTFQIKPELVLAVNPEFDQFPKDHYDVIWKFYYNFYNRTDLPVAFGNEPRVKMYPGQSSARFNYNKISAGISTENLWWGPGMRNSLLMSNSAPGFLHFTFNSREPIRTRIGSFEGQFIAGRLDGSRATPPDPLREYRSTVLYQPKPNDWRYISGLIMTYQPDLLPGLFLGFSRTSQLYGKDLNSIGDYLPFFSSYNSNVIAERPTHPDRYTSVFMRWLLAKSKAEVYFEYGHNNQLKSISDFVKDPDDGRAYIFGMSKVFDLSGRSEEGILARLEFTQLSQTSASSVLRGAQSWYVDDYVRHGYTQLGESLGAGAGPGAEVQTLDVNWIKGIKSLGLRLERYVHNQDFFYYAYEPSKDYRRHWTDISAELNGRWDYKNFVLNGAMNFTKSVNYGWYMDKAETEQYYRNGVDAFNVRINLGLTYRFY